MDWTRARAILLAAFAVVNLILAYALWGPKGEMNPSEPTARSQMVQLRTRLDERGLLLPSGITLPTTPPPMHFLRVEFRPDPPKPDAAPEPFEGVTARASLRVRYDPTTRETVLEPARAEAKTQVDLSDRGGLLRAAEEFLRQYDLLPDDVQLSGIFLREDGAVVEFVPAHEGLPVFSGYLRVYLSQRGIERAVMHWVEPVGFKEGAAKAVRPAAEALLRLAGHLQADGEQVRTIVDVRLGYYSGPSVTVPAAEEISAWDTVPVWRITLDNGQVYYVNAFNGELES